jgi:serine protease Do
LRSIPMRRKTSARGIKALAVAGFIAGFAMAAVPASVRAQGRGPGPGAPQPGAPQAQAAPPPAAGWLGVAVDEVTPDKVKQLGLHADRGVVIGEVQDASPAAKGGLQTNDVVTEFDGQGVEGELQFQRLVRETPPGRSVKLSVWRAGKSQNLSVEIGSAPGGNLQAGAGPGNRLRFGGGGGPGGGGGAPGPNGNFFGRGGGNPAVLGITAQNLTAQLGDYFGVPNAQGVLVTDVPAGSPGEKAGLKAGDVITKVEGMPVPDTTELQGLLQQKQNAQSIALTVIRKGVETHVNVQPQTSSAPQRRNAQGGSL